jgi:signal transduction histidine kinase
MKIQTKVTLLFIISNAALLILFSGFFFFYANYYAFEDFYKRLETRVRVAWAIHINQGKEDEYAVQTLRQQYLEKLPSEKEYIYELDSVTQLIPSINSSLPMALVQSVLEEGEARYRNKNAFYAGKLYKNGSRQFIVVVSANDPYSLQELLNLRRMLIIAFLITISAVYVVGKLFSFHTFKPVREIIHNVQGITAHNLHLRLNTGDGKDEIGELSQTFNDMLTRLETAFETQNNFVSNASHELRTPLTIIRGEAELTLNKHELNDDHRHSLQIILYEAEKLSHILTSLLSLAQSGFDGKKQHWEILRTDELIWQVKETTDRIYPHNHLQIDLGRLPADESLLQVQGNVNLLNLAISNIALNACKYSDNKVVVASLFSENNKTIISVKDQGIGIPEEEVKHIFEPFFRASNTAKFEGYGIGLPLALNIIRLHKGSITINTKEHAGTEIQIILPIAQATT